MNLDVLRVAAAVWASIKSCEGLRVLKCDGNHQPSSRFVLLETQHYAEVMYRAILRSLSGGTFDRMIFVMISMTQ